MIAALAMTQVAALVVILSLPPPALGVYTVADVVAAVRLEPSAPREGHPLVARIEAAAPTGETEGFRRRAFRFALAQTLGVDADSIVITQPSPKLLIIGPRRPLRDDQPLLFGPFKVGVRQASGRWLVVSPTGGVGIDAWQQRLLLVFAVAAMSVTPLAWWFARRLAAPIAALAAGAERLGRDPNAPPLPPRGSNEVIAAVIAFNQMQERLRRHVEYRTSLVGAIAHDLRTPLTRLRFRIEAVPEALREKLIDDIDEMDAMVAATLDFVREAVQSRPRGRLEIASLVETVMDEAAETGADVAVDRAERLVVDGDPIALKRLLVNLVNNALKFGGSARARVYSRDGLALIDIDDAGPGMPEADMERAFEPFQRLEASRSRDTGGLGLGLAVARGVARAHGGDVRLFNRKEGGLRASLSLPLSVS